MKKIDLVIDARMITENLHGIARYTYEIIKYISKQKEFNLYVLVNDEEMFYKIFGEKINVKLIKMKSKFLSLYEQIELPLILNKLGGNFIFHTPSFCSSPFIKIKTLMTIHDLNHLRYPQYYSWMHKYYYDYIVKPSAKKSEIILTVSEFSKKEILEWLSIDENKVISIYNGVDENFKKINDLELLNKIKQKYDLPEKFVLYIGNQKPHKNVETLIKSMQHVNEDICLVLNGKLNERCNKIIVEAKLENRIKFIGYVEEIDLPYLYNLASVFVYPSYYEGFGLPPLEAMACGCPTLVSNVTSLPEVVGNEEMTFNPYDERDIGYKINNILSDNDFRRNIINYGLNRAREFSWYNICKQIIDVYKKVDYVK